MSVGRSVCCDLLKVFKDFNDFRDFKVIKERGKRLIVRKSRRQKIKMQALGKDFVEDFWGCLGFCLVL